MIQTDALAAALRIPASRAALWAGPMSDAMALAEVGTLQRLACWLSQIGHETMRLRFVREIWGPTPAQARYEPTTALSARLGNRKPGDGRRYLGRGLIQTTGLANYVRATLRIRQLAGNRAPDFVRAPAMLEVPEWAAMSAAVYWIDRGLNAAADSGDLVLLTRRINGGTNGLADRLALYAQVRAALR